jgi:hypothetical protein
MFGKRKPDQQPPKKPSTKGLLDPKLALDKPFEFESNAYDQALDRYALNQSTKGPNFINNAPRPEASKRNMEQSYQFANELIGKLPSDLSLINLYADFPHVLDKIAMAWGDHVTFYALMDDLLIDKRGGRTGFPFKAAIELSRLAEHYEQYVSKRPKSKWDVVQKARENLYK